MRSFIRNIVNFDIFLGLISGPIVSTLLMLLPLGVLVGLFEVLDPAFVAYEYIPEEILFIPWALLMIFISFVNTRASYLLHKIHGTSTTYLIQTDKYFNPTNTRLEQDEFPGQIICLSFQLYLNSILPDFSNNPPYHKDYGWSILADKDENSLIEITFAFSGIDQIDPHIEIYEISIDYLPPFNPFSLVNFAPNTIYYSLIHDALESFMKNHGINLCSN